MVAADVGIDLCGGQLLVAEDILQDADIHLSRLVKQSCGSMAQLVHGQIAVTEACKIKIAINEPLDGLDGEPETVAADKQGIRILAMELFSFRKILG